MIIIMLWAAPSILGYSAKNLWIQKYLPIQIDGLSIGMSQFNANEIRVKTGAQSIKFQDIHIYYKPWNWVQNGVSIDRVEIGKINIKTIFSDKVDVKKTDFKLPSWIVPIRSFMVKDVLIEDNSIGKFEGKWKTSSDGYEHIQFFLYGPQQASFTIVLPNKKMQGKTQFKLSVLDIDIMGDVSNTEAGWKIFINEFKDIHPNGLILTHQNNHWVLKDPDLAQKVIGDFGIQSGFLHLVSNHLDLMYKYHLDAWSLNVKSRFWEGALKYNKQLDGSFLLKQYRYMQRLVSGKVVIQHGEDAMKLNADLKIFHYQSKDRLKVQLVKKAAQITGKVIYEYENGSKIYGDLVADGDHQVILKERGIINKMPFSSSQKITWLPDQVTVHWSPIKYGKLSWVNHKDTLIKFGDEIVVTPSCFLGPDAEKLCINVSIPKEHLDSAINVNYDAKGKVDLSGWLPDQFILDDLLFKGAIDAKYFIGQDKLLMNLDIHDISFRFEPLITSSIPFSAHSVIMEGKAFIALDHNGQWQYKGRFIEEHGGELVFDHSQPKNIKWKDILTGYKDSSYLRSSGEGVWNQKQNEVSMQVYLDEGMIRISNYYPVKKNPLNIERFNLPVKFNLNFKSRSPIAVNIVGIEGQLVLDLMLQERDALWIGKGDIHMLPGAIFRKSDQPVSVKSAQLKFYNSDVTDPYVLLELEKKQTLLTNDSQHSSYKDELLGVRIYGKINDYQMQTYSNPPGVNEFVILQAVLIDPLISSKHSGPSQSKHLGGLLTESLRNIRSVLPVDQISFRPAEEKNSITDPYAETSTVAMMKRITQTLGFYARIGGLPQDNIFSLIYKKPNHRVGTQLYSNYQSQGFNFIYSY